VLVVLSDTHSESGPELTPHLRTQVDDAEGLLHAGDFTTEQTLDSFESLAPAFWGVTHYKAEAPSSRSAGLPMLNRKHKRVGWGG
jgi:predicted phosphodiesterase